MISLEEDANFFDLQLERYKQCLLGVRLFRKKWRPQNLMGGMIVIGGRTHKTGAVVAVYSELRNARTRTNPSAADRRTVKPPSRGQARPIRTVAPAMPSSWRRHSARERKRATLLGIGTIMPLQSSSRQPIQLQTIYIRIRAHTPSNTEPRW